MAAQVQVLKESPSEKINDIVYHTSNLYDMLNSDTEGFENRTVKLTLKKDESLTNALKQSLYIMISKEASVSSVSVVESNFKKVTEAEVMNELISSSQYDELEQEAGDEVTKDLNEAVWSLFANISSKTHQVFEYAHEGEFAGGSGSCRGFVFVTKTKNQTDAKIADFIGSCYND
jgi:4-diphosphocytidyl-2C-methyl-D-erythritol kinase